MRILKKILLSIVVTILVLSAAIYLFMQQASFGKIPSGQHLEKIKKSEHFNDNNFVNLSPTAMMAEGASYFKLIKKQFEKVEDRTPVNTLPVLQPVYQTGNTAKPVITWYGHSTYLVQINGKNILLDPVFSERASFVQYLGPKAYPGTNVFRVEDLPTIDAVIISHDHYDHLDYNTILKLKATVKHFYMGLGVGSHFLHWGIKPEYITELDWWQNTSIPGGITLTATPARHFSGRGFVRNKTLWASYVLDAGDYKLYLGGDSGYDTHFKQIGDKFGPFDLAVLENGQYNADWPYIHMMPEQTVQASIDLKAKVLFPVHWGKFTLALHPWNEPAIRITKRAKEVNMPLTTPKIGQQIILDSLYPAEKWWYLDKTNNG